MPTFNTLNSLIHDVLNTFRASNISESERLSKRQVEQWIHNYRAVLIKQDLDKGRSPNEDYIQEIQRIKLVKVDYVEKGDSTGVYRFRSEIKIPSSLDLHYKNGIVIVSDLLGNEIQVIPESRVNLQKYKKYVGNNSYAYLADNYLFVESCQLLEYVKLKGIFSNPMDVDSLNGCADINSEYPISANMIPVLKDLIFSKELAIYNNTTSDKLNNSNNNSSSNITNTN